MSFFPSVFLLISTNFRFPRVSNRTFNAWSSSSWGSFFWAESRWATAQKTLGELPLYWWMMIIMDINEDEALVQHIFITKMATYCWWFRNPASQLVRQISHYFQGFIHPRWCRFTLPMFNSEFSPEKLPKPNRKESSSSPTIFQGRG